MRCSTGHLYNVKTKNLKSSLYFQIAAEASAHIGNKRNVTYIKNFHK